MCWLGRLRLHWPWMRCLGRGRHQQRIPAVLHALLNRQHVARLLVQLKCPQPLRLTMACLQMTEGGQAAGDRTEQKCGLVSAVEAQGRAEMFCLSDRLLRHLPVVRGRRSGARWTRPLHHLLQRKRVHHRHEEESTVWTDKPASRRQPWLQILPTFHVDFTL